MTNPNRLTDVERWGRVAQIFADAVERDPASRAAFIDDAVCGDDALRREVEALVEAYERAGTFMEAPAIRVIGSPVLASAIADITGGVDHGSKPKRFGDYELLGEIARGGMGVVYRARQVGLNRLVALKTIMGGALASPTMVQRFRTEAEAAASLIHPNIVPIYEIGEHEGQHYFSMRLLEGGSLQQRIAEFQLRTAESRDRVRSRSSLIERHTRIARLVTAVARAVHFAHQRGVLHRDLKPANILLDGDDNPVVADFGIAKLLGTSHDQTQSLVVVGTPNYMSPEQCAGGSAQLTTAADVFSLGAILYQLLTGRLPFDAATPIATMQLVVEREPTAPRSLDSGIDPDLETICLKCLNKDPQKRYSSAEAVADDLDRWLAGEPIAARPVTAAERVWRWCRRKPVVAALALGLFVATLTGLAISTLEWRRAEQSAVTLEDNLYVADIGLAFQSWAAGHIARTRELLERHRPQPGERDLRTFEWRYLFGVSRPRELLTIKSGSTEIWGSAISPDGRLLATGAGSADGTVRLWSLPYGTLTASFRPASTIVYCLAFSPDGKLLAAAIDSQEIVLWDVVARKEATRLRREGSPVLALRFSPDGRTLAAMGGYPYAIDRPAELTLWDVATRQTIANLSGHTSSSGWMGFSPDGRLLATPHGDGTIILWDVASKQRVATLAGHRGLVICVRFSPDGRLLASCGIDGTVRLWDAATHQPIATLGSHEGAAYSVAFSPAGDRLISGGIDHVAKLWDIKTRQQITTFRGHASRIFSVNFAPDGRTVVTASLDGTARIWDATVRPDSTVFDRHTGSSAFVTFSSDGRRLARADLFESRTTLWDAQSLSKLAELRAGRSSFSPDGKMLATSVQKQVTVWDVALGEPRARTTIELPAAATLGPIFSADGRYLAIDLGGESAAVGIWDIPTQRRITLLDRSGTKLELSGYAISADGRFFATGYSDGRVVLWNAQTWASIRELQGHSQRVVALSFSPNGDLLATGSADTTVRLWNTASGTEPPVLEGDSGEIGSLAFAPDGETLAAGGADGIVKFWNVRTAREVAALKAHESVVSSLAFSPDGRTLASISVDQTMRLWRAPALAETQR